MSHQHNHHLASNSTKVLFLNLTFAAFEAIAGVIFNSTALISDAIHDFGDAFILLLSVLLEKVSKRPANETYSFGYRRISIIGAIINCSVLLVGSVLILIHAVERILQPEPVISLGMFVMAFFGVAVNGYGVFRFSKSKNILDKSVMLHLLEDLIGWIAVLLVSIVIYFTNWYILDPIISVVIVAIILFNVYKNLKECYQMIMCATPNQKELANITNRITSMAEVKQMSDVHYWSLDGSCHILTAKITVTIVNPVQFETLRSAIDAILADYPITNSTLEWLIEADSEKIGQPDDVPTLDSLAV